MLLYKKKDQRIESKEVSIDFNDENYDVIVVGLGTAGAIAAITAARLGMRVLGIEATNYMGGQSTGGGVFIYYLGETGGIYEEIDRECIEIEKRGYVKTNKNYVPNGIHPDVKKYILEKMAVKEGVTICYDAVAIGLYEEEKQVKGVQWIQKGNIRNTLGNVILDCTGDGHICELLGCNTSMGRDVDSQCQPFSSVMTTLDNGRLSCRYNDCGYVNQYDEEEICNKLIDANTQPLHLREHYGEEDQIIAFSQQLGSREGKCILGEESLTVEHVLGKNSIQNPLFFAFSNIDIHGKDIAFESKEQQYWTTVCGLWGVKIRLPIPAGALIPKGYSGILAAGRHISVDHDIASAIRMKRDMHKCGEAAATLAAVAIKTGNSLKETDYNTVATILSKTGCLELKADTINSSQVEASFYEEDQSKIEWYTKKDEIKAGLSSDKPGIALWSVKIMGASVLPQLRLWIQEENTQLQKNTALALGIVGSSEGIVILRKMVEEKDMFCFRNSTMYTQPRSIAAIFLLGELGDTDSIGSLQTILDTPNMFQNMKISATEFIEDANDMYFQYFSYAFMALIQIGNQDIAFRAYIKKIINSALEKEDCKVVLNLKDGKGLKYSMKSKLQELAIQFTKEWY